MKKFKEIREAKSRSRGRTIKGIKTSVIKKGGKYVAIIDGDTLDKGFLNQDDAQDAIDTFMKNYKK